MPRKHRITLNLFSNQSIQQAQEQVRAYKAELIAKCETFIRELARVGIMVGERNTGEYGRYITFTAEIDPTQYGCKAVVIATNTGLIRSEWFANAQGDVKTADVSPLLMAEFGSGLRADDSYGKRQHPPMGTGTFPDQTHAEDPGGWWWKTLDGEWHHSYGERPTYPMAKASIAMASQIHDVARAVFG